MGKSRSQRKSLTNVVNGLPCVKEGRHEKAKKLLDVPVLDRSIAAHSLTTSDGTALSLDLAQDTVRFHSVDHHSSTPAPLQPCTELVVVIRH